MNIHFICRGNVLRSLTAETYLKSLGIKNINATSSGAIVDWTSPIEQSYFANTLILLDRHGIKCYAKNSPDQLTQSRTDNQDITVFMNQRVYDESIQIVSLPSNAIDWNITDIGEGQRMVKKNRHEYEEEIYLEIVAKVDTLVNKYHLSK